MAQGHFKVENYHPNSFIIVEGKQSAGTFFIILKGRVKINNQNPSIADRNNKILDPGDFFGVISCMSTHARIETAVSLEMVSVIVVRREQFGELIQRNPDIAMKIIRFFSRQLRFFDNSITKLTLKDQAEENPEHLYQIGEYYLVKRAFNHAAYAFQRYLQYCPAGKNSERSLHRLKQLKAPFKAPEPPPTKGLTRTYKDNTMIFCENEFGFELFIIQSGQVKITKVVDEEILLAMLKPGDVFGEMALLDNRPRSASAITFGDVAVMVINKDNFETMVISQPQLATRLIVLLSERIWTAKRQLENLTINDQIGRAYDILLIQLEKQKIQIRPKQPHNFQFGVNELTNMIGATKKQADALMVQLFAEKIITIDEGKLICNDIFELEKTARFYLKKSALERKREANKNS
ncbi:MAG: cyclic nucleotide-binding domain-containing protein [Spirochaetes bacterium]|nr:cyclic nucleotide-binding domain-containing protein [Spirochaetota bacterium]MBN2771567.1 cyclic nucleotide-binding domain-containing protein [Spirochaetota bacterium]